MTSIFEKYDPYFEKELSLAMAEALTVKNLEFEILFEADEPIQASTIQQNEQNKKGVFGHIKNALEALRKMITSMLSRISDWLQKLTMGNKERKLYERVVEACKKDPELANKRITVTDFRQSKQEYLRLMQQIENAEKQGNMSEVDRLMEQIKQGLSGALGGVTVSVGMQAAMNIAQSNREMAALISNQLQSDSKWLDMISNAVGQKEAQKFQKDIQNYTKECRVKRFILGIRGKMFSNVADAVGDIYKSAEQLVDFNNSTGAQKVVKGAKILGNKTTTDMAGRMLHNDQIRGAVKAGVGIGTDVKKAQFQAGINNMKNKHYRRAEARRRAKGNMTNASSFDFVGSGIGQATNKLQDFFSNLGQ